MYSTGEISPDAMRKPAGNKGRHTEGQHIETLGSTWERDWVVGSQILTQHPHILSDQNNLHDKHVDQYALLASLQPDLACCVGPQQGDPP